MEIFLLILFGVISGIIGGMGMGGGTLLIPLLTIFLGIKQHIAQGINLIAFLPMSVIALIFHIKNKLVNFKKSWIIIILGVASSIGGAILSLNLKGEQVKTYFGIFLIALGVFQFVSIFFNGKKKKYNKQ